jgi:hypothetical protein
MTKFPNEPNFQIFLGEGGRVLTGKHEIMKYMKEAGRILTE